MTDFFEITLKAYWETDAKDPWCDGNEEIYRCLFAQIEELEPHKYLPEPEDVAFAHRWCEELCDKIYFMILGGYVA